jgi:hypothetical protein
MQVSVQKSDVRGICVKAMNDGDIGEVIQWGTNREYIGAVVQRYQDNLVRLGHTWRQGWPDILKSDSSHEDCRVRLLEAGETLILGVKG